MMNYKDDIQKELEEVSPRLAQMKGREEGYRVPVDYFSNLSERIIDQCKAESIPKPQPNIWDSVSSFLALLFKPGYAMAAATLALVLTGFFLWLPRDVKAALAEDSLDKKEILAYVNDNIEDFELDLLEDDLVEQLSMEDLIDLDENELNLYIDENVLDGIDETTLEELL